MLPFPSTIFPVPSRLIVNSAKERINVHYHPSTAIMVDTKEWDSMRFENSSQTSVCEPRVQTDIHSQSKTGC